MDFSETLWLWIGWWSQLRKKPGLSLSMDGDQPLSVMRSRLYKALGGPLVSRSILWHGRFMTMPA
jgi:hypothetical protein